MAPPDTVPAVRRPADSLAILPDDLAAVGRGTPAATGGIGFSYFVFGADVSDALAPVVAELAAT